MAEAEALLEADGLVKRYDGRTVVDGASFTVRRGEVAALLGPNGAGKTTTLRLLAGVLEPDGGAARIAGRDMARARRAGQAQLGYLPENAPLYPEMSPQAYLDFVAALHGLAKPARGQAVARAAALAGLADVMGRPAGALSKGYRRRLGLAAAIVHDPPVLILDEPTDGLDPNQKRAVRALIAALKPEKAIVVSTHLLEEPAAIADRVVLMAGGRVRLDEPAAAWAARGAPDAAFATLTGAA